MKLWVVLRSENIESRQGAALYAVIFRYLCALPGLLSTCATFEECLAWKGLDKYTLQIVVHLCSCHQDIY